MLVALSARDNERWSSWKQQLDATTKHHTIRYHLFTENYLYQSKPQPKGKGRGNHTRGDGEDALLGGDKWSPQHLHIHWEVTRSGPTWWRAHFIPQKHTNQSKPKTKQTNKKSKGDGNYTRGMVRMPYWEVTKGLPYYQAPNPFIAVKKWANLMVGSTSFLKACQPRKGGADYTRGKGEDATLPNSLRLESCKEVGPLHT